MPSKFVMLAAAILLVSGCSRDLSGDTYTAGSTGGKVLEGTIVSARAVTIKEHDKLQDNTLGGVAGGAAGAVGGASVGHGNGSLAAAIGGAVIGAVGGAAIEDALGTSQGMEYLVKIDKKYLRELSAQHKKIVKESIKQPTVENDISASMDVDTKTDILSVVQKGDPALTTGSRVYIVYNNDRPRLAPMK